MNVPFQNHDLHALPSLADRIHAINEGTLRIAFESMHKNRNLSRNGRRGTYDSPAIAALWNQHVRTAVWLKEIVHSWRE